MPKKQVVYSALLTVGLGLGLLLGQAESPDRLDGGEIFSKPPATSVALPPPPEAEKAPEPEPALSSRDALASLAPESFASEASLTDAGFGTAFGSGGSGPAIAGGGGLGTDGASLVGEKTSVDRPPRVVSRPPLDYPPEARSRGIKGFVVVRLRVGVSGQVDEALIAESEPKGFFDEAALRSVRQWKFEPGVQKGQTSALWILQRIRFEMN